jgi:hypothetical protein
MPSTWQNCPLVHEYPDLRGHQPDPAHGHGPPAAQITALGPLPQADGDGPRVPGAGGCERWSPAPSTPAPSTAPRLASLASCRRPKSTASGPRPACPNAASSIRSRVSISSLMRRTNDASSAVVPGLIRAQYAASRYLSARRLLIGARVATCGIPRHLSASRRPSGRAGPGGFPVSFTRRRTRRAGIGLTLDAAAADDRAVMPGARRRDRRPSYPTVIASSSFFRNCAETTGG